MRVWQAQNIVAVAGNSGLAVDLRLEDFATQAMWVFLVHQMWCSIDQKCVRGSMSTGRTSEPLLKSAAEVGNLVDQWPS